MNIYYLYLFWYTGHKTDGKTHSFCSTNSADSVYIVSFFIWQGHVDDWKRKRKTSQCGVITYYNCYILGNSEFSFFELMKKTIPLFPLFICVIHGRTHIFYVYVIHGRGNKGKVLCALPIQQYNHKSTMGMLRFNAGFLTLGCNRTLRLFLKHYVLVYTWNARTRYGL